MAASFGFLDLPTLMVAVVFGLLSAALLLSTAWGRRILVAPRIRSRLERAIRDGFPLSPTRKIPAELEAATRELESLGFATVRTGRQPRSVVAIAVRRTAPVLAEAWWMARPVRGLPRTGITLSSIASKRKGMLQTSNGGFATGGWSQAVTQVFPGSTIAVLVERHDEARHLLEERGVRFEDVPPEDALELRAWTMSESAAAVLQLPDDDLVKLSRNVVHGQTSLGSILDDPETIQRIHGLRA
jgi:hypothetical protein